jgi:hypothetical protein
MYLPCSQVAAFRRCGGRSAMAGINAPDPGICCESGTLCKFYNEYFWQCQPRGYVPLPEPEATFDGPSCKGKTQVGRCSMMDCPLHVSVRMMTPGTVRVNTAHSCIPRRRRLNFSVCVHAAHGTCVYTVHGYTVRHAWSVHAHPACIGVCWRVRALHAYTCQRPYVTRVHTLYQTHCKKAV